MDFKVDLVGRRERRAMLLVAVAMVAVAAASITYLRPPAPAPSAPIVSTAPPPTGTFFQPVAYEVLPGTGRPTGSYFVWRVDVALPGGSGGHRAG